MLPGAGSYKCMLEANPPYFASLQANSGRAVKSCPSIYQKNAQPFCLGLEIRGNGADALIFPAVDPLNVEYWFAGADTGSFGPFSVIEQRTKVEKTPARDASMAEPAAARSR